MSLVIGSLERPLRVAVVGSGPSGFYAIETLFSAKLAVTVDVFDRLPTPFGLVRYGVAPDHPKIKNVIKIYEKIALDPRFYFFGNVNIGHDVSVKELQKFYDCIIFACGAETDKHLNIPNENLVGSHTATEFVGWYNGHPDYQSREFDLSHPVAVIVGLGNVAMDVARILSKTADELKGTDITQKALAVLSQSKIREVHVVGRRGPVQSAFTPVEIKEFGELSQAMPVVKSEDLVINDASQKELADPQAAVRKKNFEILKKYSAITEQKPRKIFFHFLKSPVEIKGKTKVEQIVLEKNILSGEAGQQSAKGTKVFETIDCGNIFRSVGYRGVPIDGVPFDIKKGIFANNAGRILENGKVLAGLYAAGWIKRGPTGVIGTNKPDSEETVNNLLADVAKLKGCESPSRESVEQYLKTKNIRFVNYQDWQKINAAEIERGKPLGKPREKITTLKDIFSCLS
ncbi:MAG: NADP oxidoreductase [Candidatus Omnitrophica bacterium]|nr:NADP oxidoreductase [Candidatus Omnitrophota bacterium]